MELLIIIVSIIVLYQIASRIADFFQSKQLKIDGLLRKQFYDQVNPIVDEIKQKYELTEEEFRVLYKKVLNVGGVAYVRARVYELPVVDFAIDHSRFCEGHFNEMKKIKRDPYAYGYGRNIEDMKERLYRLNLVSFFLIFSLN